jgi:Zn-dependent protease with chaperone function
MNEFGIQLVWWMVRVTLLSSIALLLVHRLSKGNRLVPRSLFVVTMLLLFALPTSLFWPSDYGWSVLPESLHIDLQPAVSSNPQASTDSPSMNGVYTSFDEVTEFLGVLSSAKSSPEMGFQWSWIAWIFFAGIGFSLIWFGLGWWSIRRLYLRTQLIRDPILLHEVNQIAKQFGITRSIQVRECNEPGLAATIGIYSPILILPPECHSWSDEERRSVIAHELAHICKWDFLWTLIARLCLVLHVYHPLVSCLMKRFRWQQEISADELAATVTGGNRSYSRSLAKLALRLPSASKSTGYYPMPAMNGGILLRRIAMLRVKDDIRSLSRIRRYGILGLLALIGLSIAILQGPAAPMVLPEEDKLAPFDLSYIQQAEDRGVFAVHLSEVIRQPGVDPFVKKYVDMVQTAIQPFGIKWPEEFRLQDIEQIVAPMVMSTQGTGKPNSRSLAIGSTSFLVRMHQDFDWVKFIKSFPIKIEEVKEEGVHYWKMEKIPQLGPLAVHFIIPDTKTIVFLSSKDDQSTKEYLKSLPGKPKRNWGSAWKLVERSALAWIIDNGDHHFDKTFAKDLKDEPDAAKILEESQFIALGIELGDNKPVRIALDLRDNADAKTIEKQVERLAKKTVFNQLADEMKELETDKEAKKDPVAQAWFNNAKQLIESSKISWSKPVLEWKGYSTVRLKDLMAAVELNAKSEKK